MEQQNLRATKALFDGRRLTLARLYNELTKADLAHKVGVSPAAIGQYESGKGHPSPDTIAKLRWELKFPTAFFESGRPSFPLSRADAHFRSLTSASKRKQDKLLVKAELLVELVHQLEQYANVPPPDLPEIVLEGESSEDIEDAADKTRETWMLGKGPINNVVRMLEKKGCVVMDLPHEDHRVDAFSTVIGKRPMIFLNYQKANLSVGRQRLNTAHEFGHIVLHQDLEPGSRRIERQAYRYAAALLMPRESIYHELPRRVHWPSYLSLKKRWYCSLKALLKRSADLGTISEHQYKRGLIDYNRYKWGEGEPGDEELGELERPLLIYKALELLEKKRDLGLDEFAALLRLEPDRLSELVPKNYNEKIDLDL